MISNLILEKKLKRELLSRISPFTKEQQEKVLQAFKFAKEKHKGQKFGGTRYNYFLHPAYSGLILAEWNQNWEVICAGLLHDVVEDCEVSLETIRRLWNHRVAFLVDGMSWERRWNKKEKKYLKDWDYYFKKMCKYSVQDPSLILVHLADKKGRITGLLNISLEKTNKSNQKIKERFEIYYPFYVPFYREIGLVSYSERTAKSFLKYIKKPIKSKLGNYVSKNDLRKIKESLNKMDFLDELK
jgi:(p)ppGpp synthase/HD superfamily hydrolase